MNMIKEFVDSEIREKLQKKGYKPDVITALIPFGGPTLWMMNEIDDNTFGKVGNENRLNKSEADLKLYRDAAESLRVLGRNNSAFAESVARRYQSNPHKYENDARTFANQMYVDPDLCRKVIELAQSQKITELEKVAKNPGQYMASVAPKPSAAPAPVAVVAGGENAGAGKPAGKPGKGKKPAAPAAPQPAAPSAAPATVPDEPSSGESYNENYTAEEAKAKFGKWMSDPKNEKLAKKISEKEGLRADIEKRLEQNPNLVRNFMAKGNIAMYQAFLDKGDINGFMNEFAGPVVTEAMPDMSMDGILKNGLAGMLDLFKPFLGIMGNQERGESIFDKFARGIKDPKVLAEQTSLKVGDQIFALLNSGDKKKMEYGASLMNNAVASAGMPGAHGEHERRVLQGAGVNTGLIEKAQKQEIIGLTHIKVLLSPDGKSKTVDANPVIRVKEPSKPDYTVDRVARDAERAAGVERDEFGFVKLSTDPMPAGPQPTGAKTFPVSQ